MDDEIPSSLIIIKPKYRKDELYKKEQEDLLLYILKNIGINKNNLSFDRKEIDTERNKEIIRSKKEEIKKIYCVNNWNSTKTGKNLEINTLKYICRYNNININITEKKIKEDNKYKTHRIYNFIIPNEILNYL